MAGPDTPPTRSKFPPLYWLAVIFEFFERGSYYGVMSILSLYLVDHLGFAKQDVGIIKGTITPLLYFLPIIAGALADRFGFRRLLLVAFTLLGSGYFLVSQAQSYATVFLALIVVGIGAGTFKPVISGTIARSTDETNSTLGFGIFYWTINLGAFVVPLVLVPYLKHNVGWSWVMLAAAIGTSVMLIPTFFVYRDPPAPRLSSATKLGLLQTLASAFEIIYSPFVLLAALGRRTGVGAVLTLVLGGGLLGIGGWRFVHPSAATLVLAAPVLPLGKDALELRLQRNLGKKPPYTLTRWTGRPTPGYRLVLHDPDRLERQASEIVEALRLKGLLLSPEALRDLRRQAEGRSTLSLSVERGLSAPWQLESRSAGHNQLRLRAVEADPLRRTQILTRVREVPPFAGLTAGELDDLMDRAQARPFLVLFLGLLFAASLIILRLQRTFRTSTPRGQTILVLLTLAGIVSLLALLPELTLFTRILCGVIACTLVSLYAIDVRQIARFYDHLRFLLMIFIYAGFWVLYFQMFDSVLWYVQAYVDASSLNRAVNGLLQRMGIEGRWAFDVEHVTVINAGTIILLQLLVSQLVKKTRALPTMIVGICLGTVGMAVLAISPSIWIFILGLVIFSLGEMTAHPKFIAYVGQIAPPSRVAMYMGYLFLYGVVGSSIGGVVGANLYVTFVEELNRPRTLWLIFAGIGLTTVVGLVLYHLFLAREHQAEHHDTSPV